VDRQAKTWYAGGLHFECLGCGNCCAGPEEGYVWICRREIELLAAYLHVHPDAVRQRYVRRHGLRTSLREEPQTKDCVFLTANGEGGGRGCAIYAVRPNQCRTWPFWSSNLASADHWNLAAQTCPGINRGRWYSFEEIEALRTQKRWWSDDCE